MLFALDLVRTLPPPVCEMEIEFGCVREISMPASDRQDHSSGALESLAFYARSFRVRYRVRPSEKLNLRVKHIHLRERMSTLRRGDGIK